MKINKQTHLPITIIIALLLVGLGCSAGTFLVRAPVPTPTPTKTPRSTFTPTLIPTDTSTPSNTPTLTPAPTNTETPIPTETPTESRPADTPTPQPEAPTNTPPPPTPAPPTNTPPPTTTPQPTTTPVPSYPFPSVVTTHPTGGEIEFRITGFVWEGNASTGFGEALQGFQMEVVTPSGEVKTSEISVGPRAGASTVMGAGDNHSMNFQFKTAPYVPGVYKVTLKKDGAQMANTIDITAQTGPPFTYAHIDFIRQR